MQKKALVAMSGGVDSSVAAYLIKKAGYETMGINMKLHIADSVLSEPEDGCGLSDASDAKAVAEKLGIPFCVVDFTDDFRTNVVDNFVRAYEEGNTPNPCIDCNKHIKFKRLFEKGMELGQDYVVTGHYVRIDRDEKGLYRLKKGLDEKKDQSYVLYSLSQSELAHTKFPLGEITKEKVREIAGEMTFLNADKKESQDICFVPDGDYVKFIKKYTSSKYPEGDFVDKDGNVLGKHRGMIGYTIGQRRGLGLALKKPMYVVEKDIENNRILLGENKDLMTRDFEAGCCNWISGSPPRGKIRVMAKTRYNQKESPAVVEVIGEGRIHVCFDEPQRAITKGQSVVLYDGDIVLGGGIIDLT